MSEELSFCAEGERHASRLLSPYLVAQNANRSASASAAPPPSIPIPSLPPRAIRLTQINMPTL
jgi:hypothetical protein